MTFNSFNSSSFNQEYLTHKSKFKNSFIFSHLIFLIVSGFIFILFLLKSESKIVFANFSKAAFFSFDSHSNQKKFEIPSHIFQALSFHKKSHIQTAAIRPIIPNDFIHVNKCHFMPIFSKILSTAHSFFSSFHQNTKEISLYHTKAVHAASAILAIGCLFSHCFGSSIKLGFF
jgi:hypothetical protein